MAPQEVGQALATGLNINEGDHLALDAEYVYFSAVDLYKVPIGGGAPVLLANSVGINTIESIAVGASGVYWAGGGVWHVGLDGGAVTQLASIGGGVALDDTYVYWTGSHDVERMLIEGGPVTVLAEGLTAPVVLVVDATNVYVADDMDSTVKLIPKTGGPAVTLSVDGPAGNGFVDLAAGPTNLYWPSLDVGQEPPDVIGLVPKAGGATTKMKVTQDPEGVAADDTGVYWTDRLDQGWIWKMPLEGGPSTPLASNDQEVGSGMAIAVDAANVYWMDGYGAIYKAPK
jgi:hypothetical protein